ncbi:uncharacterized protein LOC123211571 [Mangifera indica]|uniref:uncharacterized protein LOC123211571 n=1 Tax=Mangifera indica TaxID=29780 RepID=UPI001CF9E388|nr:uncharacterized protein LOC123211571 [Mangifera indica]
MEHSVAKDAILCLNCYLVTPTVDYNKRVDGETFVSKRKVKKYVGEHSSSHNKSDSKYVALMNQKQHIDVNLAYVSKKVISNYHVHIVRDKQPFSLLVNESHDMTVKEKMAVVFHYLDKTGGIIEHFIGIMHVKNTSVIYAFFCKTWIEFDKFTRARL